MPERIDVHHHFHVDPATLEFFRHLQRDMKMLREKLAAAIAASQALVVSETDLNKSIVLYVSGEADRTAAAVAKALEAAGIEEDAAADLISQATADAKAATAEGLAAITTNTDVPPLTDGNDTAGGADTATDTLSGGVGDDSVTGGQGSDALTAPDNANPASVPADPTDPNAQ